MAKPIQKEQFTDEEVIVFGEDHSNPPDLRLLHYNDVYHVDASSAEPVGGIARFMTVVKHYRDSEDFRDQSQLVSLFSGDAWNPSLESSVTKGMSCVLNLWVEAVLHSIQMESGMCKMAC